MSAILPNTFGQTPNVFGDLESFDYELLPPDSLEAQGAFSVTTKNANSLSASGQTGQNYMYLSLDASRCSSVYGSSQKVQPAAAQFFMIIKA